MKNILFLFMILFLFSCMEVGHTDQVVITEDDKAALRYLKEVEWPKAYHEQDLELLDRILGDDFQMIEANGNISTKATEMDWVKNNVYKPDSFRYDIERFEFLENGTAIVAGKGHVVMDSTYTIYSSSNVLVLRDGVWKAVLSHDSGVKTEPTKDDNNKQ